MKKSEQKLVRVDRAGRAKIRDARRMNLHWRAEARRDAEERAKPGACIHCGAQPCGHSWRAEGRALATAEEAAGCEGRCCEKCTHAPMAGWVHTHTIFGKRAGMGGGMFPVMRVEAGDYYELFFRVDGAVEWMVTYCDRDAPCSDRCDARPRPHFLGGAVSHMACFARGDEEDCEKNVWLRRGPSCEHCVRGYGPEAGGEEDGGEEDGGEEDSDEDSDGGSDEYSEAAGDCGGDGDGDGDEEDLPF